jgi:hypothetical protein
MTLTKAAYEMIEFLQKNIVDDYYIDIRLIKQLIIEQREIAISNAINKGSNSNQGVQYGTGAGYDGGWDNFTQNITLVLGSISPTTTSGSDCYTNRSIWKSETEIPDVMSMGRRPAVLRVNVDTPDDYEYKPNILFSSYDRAMFVGEGRFNQEQLTSYIKGDNFYIAQKPTDPSPTIASVEIEAIFSNPTEVPRFSDDTSDFPMGKLWAYMQEQILNRLIMKGNAGEDIINNSTNN